MKVIHTKDGRTLYKDDNGHWLKKGDAEKLLSNQSNQKPPISDVRDPDKETQIAKQKEIADKLNGKELSKEEKQAEFNAKCKEIQQQYVDMDVDTFAKGLTSKNINEKLGIEATENQRWELVRLFKSIAEHQHSYNENKTPKIFERFEITQDYLYDHDDYTGKKYLKMIGIYLRLKGNTGREYIDFLDSKTTHVWMGPKGGLTTYVDGREVRVSTLDAAFGSDWIESKYGKKRGKKSE